MPILKVEHTLGLELPFLKKVTNVRWAYSGKSLIKAYSETDEEAARMLLWLGVPATTRDANGLMKAHAPRKLISGSRHAIVESRGYLRLATSGKNFS